MKMPRRPYVKGVSMGSRMALQRKLEQEIHEQVRGLRRYAIMLTRDPDAAEDLVQDTLVKALAAADRWKPGSDLRVWLFRILHNTHIDEVRKRRTQEAARDYLTPAVDQADASRRLELTQVLQALDQLPEAQKKPILLVALEGMSYADAARVLNLPLGTFYSRLGRGRAALRRLLDGDADARPQLAG